MTEEKKQAEGKIRTDSPSNPNFNDTRNDFGLNYNDYQVGEDGSVYIGGVHVSGGSVGMNIDPVKEEFNAQDAHEEPEEEIAPEKKASEKNTEEKTDEGKNDDGNDEGEKGKDGEGDGEEKPEGEGEKEEVLVAPKSWRLKALGEEREITDEAELVMLANKGLGADRRFEKIAEMRKELEPFYHIALKLKDDPKFLEHVKSYDAAGYQVDGPEPASVSQEQFTALVDQQVAQRVEAGRIHWAHDGKYGSLKGYPDSREVHQRMLTDSLNWDRFTREWVDRNPKAYQEKFQETFKALLDEKMLPEAPVEQTTSPKVAERQKAVREQLKAKEVAKETARVESAKSGREIKPDDGRLLVNKAYKQARRSGSTEDWADVIAAMGLAE